MTVLPHVKMAPPSMVFVPAKAVGNLVFDNGGDVICQCFTPELAAQIVRLINCDAGLAPAGSAVRLFHGDPMEGFRLKDTKP